MKWNQTLLGEDEIGCENLNKNLVKLPEEHQQKIYVNQYPDYMNYQYFVQIVPTDIQTLIGSWPTFQYSVKEQAREVGNYGMGSGGIPGKIY